MVKRLRYGKKNHDFSTDSISRTSMTNTFSYPAGEGGTRRRGSGRNANEGWL